MPDLQLHRTKCTNLIKSVIVPNILKDLVNDVENMPYSFIVNESMSFKNKYLCICIKYYSTSQSRIITEYL